MRVAYAGRDLPTGFAVALVLTLPIGLYYRVRSQATREPLDRQQEGFFIQTGRFVPRITFSSRVR